MWQMCGERGGSSLTPALIDLYFIFYFYFLGKGGYRFGISDWWPIGGRCRSLKDPHQDMALLVSVSLMVGLN